MSSFLERMRQSGFYHNNNNYSTETSEFYFDPPSMSIWQNNSMMSQPPNLVQILPANMNEHYNDMEQFINNGSDLFDRKHIVL